MPACPISPHVYKPKNWCGDAPLLSPVHYTRSIPVCCQAVYPTPPYAVLLGNVSFPGVQNTYPYWEYVESCLRQGNIIVASNQTRRPKGRTKTRQARMNPSSFVLLQWCQSRMFSSAAGNPSLKIMVWTESRCQEIYLSTPDVDSEAQPAKACRPRVTYPGLRIGR